MKKRISLDLTKEELEKLKNLMKLEEETNYTRFIKMKIFDEGWTIAKLLRDVRKIGLETLKLSAISKAMLEEEFLKRDSNKNSFQAIEKEATEYVNEEFN